MHPSPVTVPMAFVQGMLSGVGARGLDTGDFLADAGIDPALLAQPGARVTAEQYVALFQSLTDRLDDDLLGFLPRPLRRGSFALIVRSAAAEDTLALALRRAARTFGLLQTEIELQLVQAGPLAGLALHFHDPGGARHVFLHELLLRSFWRLLAWLAGGRLPVEHFDFAFTAPAHAGSYGKIFPAPLCFGQLQSAFWFDARLLSQPVRQDRSSVRAFLADACGGNAALRARVELLLEADRHTAGILEHGPDLPQHDPPVAGHTLAGRYTLRRKLGEGGMGEVWVADQTDPVRRTVAVKLVRAGFDTELFRETTLVGRQREVGRDQADLAFADHPEQVELGQRVRIAHGVVAALAQFHRDRIERAMLDQRLRRFHAGARHVCGAEQGVGDTVAFDVDDGLAGEGGGEIGGCCCHCVRLPGA